MEYPSLIGLLFLSMGILWLLRLPLRNDGLVDFGWPASFLILTIYFYWQNTSSVAHQILCAGYGLCACRFIGGIIYRFSKFGEDRRWRYWRQRWDQRQGLFGIRSTGLNLFFFYQTQQLANVTVVALPLYLSAGHAASLSNLQFIAVSLWIIAFACENWADWTLFRFKRDNPTGGICRLGLWNYSRHPNYFFEWLIWLSYGLYVWPYADQLWHQIGLLTLAGVTYWFLVYFTGIPITEQASVERHGETYRRYQATTSRFIPWLPKK